MAKKATMLACEFGITTQAIVNNFAPILFVIFKDNFGISYTFIANLMLLNFMIQLFTDGFSIGIISAFGYRKAGIAAQISVIIGLLILGIMPHFAPIKASLVPAVIFYAFGGGLLEVMVSPIVDSLDDGNKSARMSMLHSFYCWGQMAVVLISTVVIKLFGGGVWWIMTLCWAVIPITNTVLFYLAPIPEAEEEKTETPKSLLRSRIFIMMCLLMMCAGAAEITMAQWASLFAQKGLCVSKFVGDMLGPCMFALFMGCGRLLFGIFGERLDLHRSLIVCSIFCALCYITAAVSKNAYAALFGCSLTGFSVSIMWPGVYSCSSKIIPQGGTAMFSILALFGDIGCSLGAWLCGVVSDVSLKFPSVTEHADRLGYTYEQMGLKFGIGFSAVFPLMMIVMLMRVGRMLKK